MNDAPKPVVNTELSDLQVKIKMIPVLVTAIFSVAGLWFGMIQTNKSEDQKIVDVFNVAINKLEDQNIRQEALNKDYERRLNDQESEIRGLKMELNNIKK